MKVGAIMNLYLSAVSRSLLALLLALLGVLPLAGHAQAPQEWVASKKVGNVAHFLFDARIERFDLGSARWLTPLNLPRTGATAMAVTDTALFVAYGSACYAYDASVGGEIHVRSTTGQIHELHADSDFLFINYTGQFDSVRISDRRIVNSISEYVYGSYGTVIVPSIRKIFGVTRGMSPADVVVTSYGADGNLGRTEGSPYHGDFEIGSRVFVSPSGHRVLTSSGVVYSSTDLRYVGSMGGAVEHMDFLQDGRSVVLREGKVHAHSARFFDTGSAAVPAGTRNVFSSETAVHAFRPDRARVSGISFHTVPHASMVFPPPGQGITPQGLSFVPDGVITDKEGNLLVLSRLDGCVFVWDAETQGWKDKWHVLRGEPTYMAYSDVNHRLYLSYDGGVVTKIDLADATPVETTFANMPANVHGLAAAGEFLMVADPTGAWSSHSILSSEGEELHRVDWNYYSKSYEWSPVTRRMFFIRDDTSPLDIHYEKISEAGMIVEEGESPYHGSGGIMHPIRVSRDGAQVLLGSGRIYDADGNLSQIGTLANGLVDGAWLTNTLVTIVADGGQTRWQQWSAGGTYAETSTGLLNGTPRHVRRLPNDRFVIITQVSGKPAFRIFTSAGELVQPPTPLAPADFTGSIVSGGVLLRWKDLPHETGYLIERRLNEAESWSLLVTLPANSTSYKDTSAGASPDAFYRIHALRDDLVGELSDPLQLSPLLPLSPALVEAIPTSSGAELTWQPSLRASHYRIERRLLSAASFLTMAVVESPVNYYTDRTAASDATYHYRIVGVNSVSSAISPSASVQVKTLGLPFTAIYRLSRSVSGSRNGVDQAGKIIKASIRKSEAGYVAVDLNTRTASQVLFWTETVPGSKTKNKLYRVEAVEMEYLILPLGGGKWQFSAMSATQGTSLPGQEGLWAKISQVVGTSAAYKLPATSIQYLALPAKLTGKERFTFMGNIENATSGVTSEFSTFDCNLNLVLDPKLTASTMTGVDLKASSGEGLAARSEAHAIQTVVNLLVKQGYTAETVAGN